MDEELKKLKEERLVLLRTIYLYGDGNNRAARLTWLDIKIAEHERK